MNLSNSSIHDRGVSQHRLNQMVDLLGFSKGSTPFTYLGAPIFKGKPKSAYFQPIANKIRLKLANWKAGLLSIAGRIQFVKSISIYSWPTALLREIEK
jgi:hypothetical protein